MAEKIDTIFISHATKDKVYVQELTKIIEFLTKELPEVQIFCSSIPGRGIPGGENIYDYLSKKIQGNVWVIYLLSNNYYNSPACLNEMGATWILKKKYSAFLAPHFEFKEIGGAIDPQRISYKLSDKNGLNSYKNTMEDFFDMKIDATIWESARDEIIERVNIQAEKELADNSKVQIKIEKVDYYDSKNIEIYFRIKNDENHHLEINYFTVVLEDENNNKVTKVIEKSESNLIKIYEHENKIHTILIPLEESNFSANRFKDYEIRDLNYSNLF